MKPNISEVTSSLFPYEVIRILDRSHKKQTKKNKKKKQKKKKTKKKKKKKKKTHERTNHEKAPAANSQKTTQRTLRKHAYSNIYRKHLQKLKIFI